MLCANNEGPDQPVHLRNLSRTYAVRYSRHARKRIFGHMRTTSLTESFDTIEYINGEKRPGKYFAHAQGDPNLFILRMFEDTFSLDPAHIVFSLRPY